MRERVDPEDHLAFEWEAFFSLSTDRQIGMGVGPIPWSAIDRYAERHAVAGDDECERFHRLIRAMDAAYLERLRSK